MTIFNSPYATVTFEPEKRQLILVWDGNPGADEYKNPFLKMIEFGRKHPVEAMISDISKQGIISPENRKWFEKEMIGGTR